MARKTLRGRRNLTLAERIDYYLGEMVEQEPETDCWLWKGKTRSDGYAICFINYKSRLAHQIFYEFFVGERGGRSNNLHHRCERRSCVNPEHLTLLTVADHARRHPDSMLKAIRRSAQLRRAETHCQRGHPFDDANTYWTREGWRRCRECANAKRRVGHR